MYVINQGWHTGLILPYESLNEEPFIEDTLGYSPYYEFGWGDSDFYQAEKITSGIINLNGFKPGSYLIKIRDEDVFFSGIGIIK